MGTENQNFFKWREDKFYIQITITDAEVDLSSYEAYWAMATSATASPVLVKTTPGDFSAEGGITWSAANQVRITIDSADTTGITISSYYHELTVRNGTGNSSVVASGNFDLRRALFPDAYR